MNITQDWTIVYFLQGSIFPMSRMHDESYTERCPSPSVQCLTDVTKQLQPCINQIFGIFPHGSNKALSLFFDWKWKEHVPSQSPSPKVIAKKLECTAVVSSNRTQPIASGSCRQPLRSSGHRIVVFVQSSCVRSMQRPWPSVSPQVYVMLIVVQFTQQSM